MVWDTRLEPVVGNWNGDANGDQDRVFTRMARGILTTMVPGHGTPVTRLNGLEHLVGHLSLVTGMAMRPGRKSVSTRMVRGTLTIMETVSGIPAMTK